MINRHIRFSLRYIPIIMMLVFAPLTTSTIQQIVLILVAFIYMFLIFKKRTILITKEYRAVLLVGILWTFWQLCVFFVHASGLVRLIQVLSIVLIVVGIVDSNNVSIISLMKFIAVMYVISWLVYIPFSNMSIEYSAYFGNGNAFGLMVYNTLTIFMLAQFKDNKTKNIFIILCIVFIILSGSRSALFASIITLLSSVIFRKSKNNSSIKRNSFILFWGIIAIVFVFTVIYPTLLGTELGEWLNDLSRSVFGKNFFSGRQVVWEQVIDLIMKKPMWGYGLGKVPGDEIALDLSSHSLYLQTAFQSGILGVILLILFLWQLYILCRKRKNEYSYVAMAYLLGMLVHECFEVAITQNNWPQGFFLWIILGLGIMPLENMGENKYGKE